MWNQECDLDLAFEMLQGWNHFHTDTMRGRVRSLQLRSQEAWPFFEKALSRIHEFDESLQNKIRAFYLHIYCFENALVEESSGHGDPQLTSRYLDRVVRHRLEEQEFRIANELKEFLQVLFLINQERYREAKTIADHLLESSRNRLGDEKVGFFFAASVAYKGLGDERASTEQIENALLGIPTLAQRFNMGLYAGTAMALLRFWGMADRAQEWEQFLVHLRIPERTADIFRERARRMFERSAALKRAFVF